MSCNPTFSINGRAIGRGHPTYIIAELSGNHGGSLEKCEELVRTAAKAGADAIKLQTLKPGGITLDRDEPWFKVTGSELWDGRRLHDLYEEIYTPWEWHAPLKELAKSLGMDMFSSPFSVDAVDFLEDEVNVDVYKIASFESGDTQLIKRVARTGKPVILSTGLADLSTLETAVRTLRENGCKEICLLKCTSSYPAQPSEANLAVIPHLEKTFNVVPGLSDHTLGPVVPIVAVSLGACVIEKHFIMNRDEGGPDSAFSLEPSELEDLVNHVRIAEQTIGTVRFGAGSVKESKNAHFRRSLFVTEDIKEGDIITRENVRSVRPNLGLPVSSFPSVLGKAAARDISAGTPLSSAAISDPNDAIFRRIYVDKQPGDYSTVTENGDAIAFSEYSFDGLDTPADEGESDSKAEVFVVGREKKHSSNSSNSSNSSKVMEVLAVCVSKVAKVGQWEDARAIKWWGKDDKAVLQVASRVAARYSHPISAKIDPANEKDIKIAKALGMAQEVGSVREDGKWCRRY